MEVVCLQLLDEGESRSEVMLMTMALNWDAVLSAASHQDAHGHAKPIMDARRWFTILLPAACASAYRRLC